MSLLLNHNIIEVEISRKMGYNRKILMSSFLLREVNDSKGYEGIKI
ncbi:hypothetical protein RUMHYD_00748 [Blautia hydrogenotrophica DSM 10507]|uniref:Uncharacterized protein n=1 Tax=Blautia hydrogenotrophica (strain DSM 10507 / JCM 14656 / S5a33) TaxID=476272 RepID=C0CIT1_BLAHS|nr:hypothetical protein RUMHYD_00748 [Blautia hydrogenotrophica DSM 10507]